MNSATSVGASATARSSRKAGAAGFVGTVIEYFEFTAYGLLTVVIAPQFFPSESAAASVLAGLAVFAAGYVVRPLGGVFFGWVGDRRGRRGALIATVVMMGVASVALGLLPTYGTIGVAAPVLLVLVRMLQSFSAGGELMGATTYAIESAPANRGGLYAAVIGSGSKFGGGLASLTAGIIALTTTAEQMASWGWRIPFLLCLPLTVIALFVRLRLEDSPEFAEMERKGEIKRAPFLEAIRARPGSIVRVVLIAMAMNTVASVGTVYMVIHLVSRVGMGQAQSFIVTGLAAPIAIAGMLLSGKMCDRFGKPRVLVLGLATSLVGAVPIFWGLESSGTNVILIGALIALWLFALGLQTPPVLGTITTLFPRNIRYSASAFGFNLGVIAGAGFTPLVTTLLVSLTDSSYVPAYLVMITSAVGIAALFTTRGRLITVPDEERGTAVTGHI